MSNVFTLSQQQKEATLLPQLLELTEYHRERSEGYRQLLDALKYDKADTLAGLPWLPVRLFKELELKSVADDEVFKILTSSGTTGAAVSKIYLDKQAASDQQRALSATVQEIIGPQRLPMLLADTTALLKKRGSFSARAAGVLGYMNFGRNHTFVLDEDEKPDAAAVGEFLDKHGDKPFLIFGFTFMAWLYLYEIARDNGFDLSNGILIHSGGWKKLADRAIDNDEFRRRFADDTGLTRIHNFYGMVEQIGVLYFEGPNGDALYCPDHADVIIRNPVTFEEQPVGEPGLVQVISTLPKSYPGHVLLTEDLGVVHGIDDGDWPGKRFSILGRLPRAEARGCSDTFAGGA